MPRPKSQILEFAKRGAEIRLSELAREARELIELFPHLRDAFDKDELPIPFIIAKGSGALTPQPNPSESPRRGGRPASVTGRRAAGERLKRRSAKWRKRKQATVRKTMAKG